jgi:hypothetical protein
MLSNGAISKPLLNLVYSISRRPCTRKRNCDLCFSAINTTSINLGSKITLMVTGRPLNARSISQTLNYTSNNMRESWTLKIN